MATRLLTILVGCFGAIAVLVSTSSGGAIGSMAAQIESSTVTVEDLASTPPLPFATEPTTASLERIVIAPGASSETVFYGPVLLFIEEGTLHVDWDRHRLAFVQTDDQKAIHGGKSIRNGAIPAGYGVYSADGKPGPLTNAGDTALKLLAVLFVPQPIYEAEDGGETMSATAGPPAGSPTP